MPKIAHHHHDDDTDDEPGAGQPVVRRISAAGAPRPVTTAPASVFAAGQAAKPPRKPMGPREYLDPAKVVIKTGVPIPVKSQHQSRPSPYAALFARMAVGAMVELAPRHAAGFVSWSKKHAQGQVLRRALPGGMAGIWRVEKPAASAKS